MSEENITQAPGLTLPDDAAPAEQVSATDRLLGFNQSGDPVTATAELLSDYVQEQIPYVGENLCAIHDFTLATNAGNNQLPPEGFARQNPLFKSGQTYILSGKRDGEKGGQCMVSDGGAFKVVNFYTPFTPENDVEVIYLRSTQPSSTVVYSDVKIEVGSRATPFIPGVIASVLPPSLAEQLVPGEFWLGVDGVTRQVYIRTFQGTLPATLPVNPTFRLVTMDFDMAAVAPWSNIGGWHQHHQTIYGADKTYWSADANSKKSIDISFLSQTPEWLGLGVSKYSITIKYTKA